MKRIQEIASLRSKKILLRADLDVAVKDGQIIEGFRIEKQRATLDYLVKNGAKVVIIAHISDVNSFASILNQIENLIGSKAEFLKDPEMIGDFLKSSRLNVALLDNIRLFDGEKDNREVFAKKLANGFDIYINNAFAVCHRSQASVVAITKFLPAYAGHQLIAEIEALTGAIDSSSTGKIVVIGGAKGENKVPIIKKLIDRADKVLIGGVVANDYLKAKGYEVGDSRTDKDLDVIFEGINLEDQRIISPEDFVVADGKILDIGPKTIQRYVALINSAKMIIWNGPMGMFEDQRFGRGTKEVAEAIAKISETIVGGGDTISAINEYRLFDKYKFVSTGGGAMLEFLAGNALPGIVALNR